MLRFEIVGQPVPQGSLKLTGNPQTGPQHITHVRRMDLAVWRNRVMIAAQDAGAVVITAPVALSVVFGLPRPMSQTYLRGGRRIIQPRYINTRPATMPDLDKLLRAVMDALTGVCYEDDRQVVSILTEKIYGDRTVIKIGRSREVSLSLEEYTPASDYEGQGSLPLLWEDGCE